MVAKAMSLADYVKRRNGVPLGGQGALPAMLKRSLGATSFAKFWHYWNPIWGYYLARVVMCPLSRVVPSWIALIATFLVSGLLHDVAISLVKMQLTLLLTPWFGLMGIAVAVSEKLELAWRGYPFAVRALLNLTIIVVCYLLSKVAIASVS